MIQKTEGVCGGSARIRNTRIPVRTIVSFKKLGVSNSELLKSYPDLTQQDLDEACAYYEQNQTEIDTEIQANECE
jgi:type III restriction enzyme